MQAYSWAFGRKMALRCRIEQQRGFTTWQEPHPRFDACQVISVRCGRSVDIQVAAGFFMAGFVPLAH